MAHTDRPPGPKNANRGSGGITDIKLTLRPPPNLRGMPVSQAPLPVDLLHMLEITWKILCGAHDTDLDLPDTQVMLNGANMDDPMYAAETVLVNMLSEIIDNVDRFSPWYSQPAKAFGLVKSRRNSGTTGAWVLTREAIKRWEEYLRALATAIEKNAGLFLAVNLLGELPAADAQNDPRIMAMCYCSPPNVIMVNRSLLDGEKIVCESCYHPFRAVGGFGDDATVH